MKDTKENSLNDSLISLVQEINHTPRPEGYRKIRKKISLTALAKTETLDGSETFDIIPKDSDANSTLPVEVRPFVQSKFDPNKYFSLDPDANPSDLGRDTNDDMKSHTSNTPSREYYEPISFAPSTSTEKPSDYTPIEVMEMVRELKALRK